MKVYIAGMDGYLGWSMAQYLAARGYEIAGCDNYSRRYNVDKMGSHSIFPISTAKRYAAYQEKYCKLRLKRGDLLDYAFISQEIREFEPDAVIHFAEQPSAPFSMASVTNAVWTQKNNILGTLNLLYALKSYPEIHLIHLGTMGEYGTPPCDIPEGFFTDDAFFRGKSLKGMQFPRDAGSWYHQSKVHNTNNITFACKVWGLRSTDIMQGVVYGTRIPEMTDDRLLSRFDIDEAFGTAINRFCASAVVGQPITLYGKGHQKRGFLPLKDSMQCLTLAIENPPGQGEYRVFNQLEEVYDLTDLAKRVQSVAKEFGIDVEIHKYQNPRKEMEDHYYNVDHQHLLDLGYRPTSDMNAELRQMFEDLLRYKDRIESVKETIVPKIRWDGTRRAVEIID